jgi:hypothetical protein
MWEGWNSSLEPNLRVYRTMVGPIEFTVKLTCVSHSSGDQWFVYFDGWATLADSGGPYFADSFDNLEAAETAAFRAACARFKFLEAPGSDHAFADYRKAMEAFGGNSWKVRHQILPQARAYRQNRDNVNAIDAYCLALSMVKRHRQALMQCENYFRVYYPMDSSFQEYMDDVDSMRLEAQMP